MKDRGLVIIGNGIAGITAARHLRMRSKMPIRIISSESKHFFSRTALMYVYMGHMKYEHTKPYEDHFWSKNDLELIQDRVLKIDSVKQSLQLESGSQIEYDQLLIATGSKTATYGWPGLDLKGVQGLYSLQDLQLMEETTKGIENAVIVGGGLIGVEMAEMLHTRGIHVDYLVREGGFWGNVLPKEESFLVGEVLSKEGIKLHYHTELKEIIGNEKGEVQEVITSEGQKLNCQFVGITTGVKPNIDFLKESGIETQKGVLVDQFLQTNRENIYAIGDCAQLKSPPKGRREIEAVWYVGKMMGEVVAATLSGERTEYRPGQWFNSAKFFNLEYQTYGEVNSKLEADEASIYWKSDANAQLIRLNYTKDQKKLKGVNGMGIRLDHRVFDQWLNEGKPIEKVIDQLDQADFNPEFQKVPYPIIKDHLQSELNQTS